MAKLYNKKDCKLEQGFIIKDDEQIGIPQVVYLQLERLELMVQQYQYLEEQPAYEPGPTLKGFERSYTLTKNRPYIAPPETPVTDARIIEAQKFMAEVDSVNSAKDVNNMIDQFGELVDWCGRDRFVEGDCIAPIDLAVLGNPLELTQEKVVGYIKKMVEHPIKLAFWVGDDDGDRPVGHTSGW